MSSDNPYYYFEQGNGYSVISLTPQLNDAQWNDIEKVGADLLEQLGGSKSPVFIVDLSSLNYMGSAMVALIVRLWKSVKDSKGRMVVVNREKLVYEVLELAGLHKIWVIVETREEAMKNLGVRAPVSPASSGGGTGGAVSAGSGSLHPVLVMLGSVGAIAGLAWLFSSADPKMPLVLTIVSALVAIIFGTLLAANPQSATVQKGIGFGAILLNLVLIVVGILQQ